MHTQSHLEAAFQRRLVWHLLQPEGFHLQGVDSDSGVADQAKFRLADGQVVDRVLVTGSDVTGVLKNVGIFKSLI